MIIMLCHPHIYSALPSLKILSQPIQKEIKLVLVLDAKGWGMGTFLELFGCFLLDGFLDGFFDGFLAVARDAVLSSLSSKVVVGIQEAVR